jgi:hypothetical protein
MLAGSHFKFLRKIEIDLWPSSMSVDRELLVVICKNLAEVLQPVREIGVLVVVEGKLVLGPL